MQAPWPHDTAAPKEAWRLLTTPEPPGEDKPFFSFKCLKWKHFYRETTLLSACLCLSLSCTVPLHQGLWQWAFATHQLSIWADCPSLYKIMAHPSSEECFSTGHQASLRARENPEQQSYLTQHPWLSLVAGAYRWPALHLGHATPSRSQKTRHHGRLLTCNSPCRGQLT